MQICCLKGTVVLFQCPGTWAAQFKIELLSFAKLVLAVCIAGCTCMSCTTPAPSVYPWGCTPPQVSVGAGRDTDLRSQRKAGSARAREGVHARWQVPSEAQRWRSALPVSGLLSGLRRTCCQCLITKIPCYVPALQEPYVLFLPSVGNIEYERTQRRQSQARGVIQS